MNKLLLILVGVMLISQVSALANREAWINYDFKEGYEGNQDETGAYSSNDNDEIITIHNNLPDINIDENSALTFNQLEYQLNGNIITSEHPDEATSYVSFNITSPLIAGFHITENNLYYLNGTFLGLELTPFNPSINNVILWAEVARKDNGKYNKILKSSQSYQIIWRYTNNTILEERYMSKNFTIIYSDSLTNPIPDELNFTTESIVETIASPNSDIEYELSKPIDNSDTFKNLSIKINKAYRNISIADVVVYNYATNQSVGLFKYANNKWYYINTTFYNFSVGNNMLVATFLDTGKAQKQVKIKFYKLSASQLYASNSTQTITNNTSEIVFNNNSNTYNIIIPPGINQQINISLADVINGNVTLQKNITFTKQDGNNEYLIIIPDNTLISGGSGWDGKMKLPELKDEDDFTIGNGRAKFAMDIGGDTNITFSKPVKIKLSGMHGKVELYDIPTICDDDIEPSNINANGPKECYIDSGNDLLIFTYHFTTFAAYSEDATTTTTTTTNNPSGPAVYSLTINMLASGIEKNVGAADSLNFYIGTEKHKVSILSVTSDSVKIKVESNPQEEIMKVGSSYKFELTGDEYYDIEITLNKIQNKRAYIKIQKINEKIEDNPPTTIVLDSTAGNNAEQINNDADLKENSLYSSRTYIYVIGIILATSLVFIIYKNFKKIDKPYKKRYKIYR